MFFATVPLGMGIDLKDVNTVVHYGAPPEPERLFSVKVIEEVGVVEMLCPQYTGSLWTVQ